MATIVVSRTGNDTTGTGSSANPYRSVLKGLQLAAVGDTIEQRGGDYDQTVDAFVINGRDSVTIQDYVTGGVGETVWNQAAGSTGTYGTNGFGVGWRFDNCRPSGITVRKNPAAATGQMGFRHVPTPPVPAFGVQPGGKDWAAIETRFMSGQPSPVGATASTGPSVIVDGVTMTNLKGKCVSAFQTGVIVRNSDLSHASIGVFCEGNVGFDAPGGLVEDNELHHMDKLWQDTRASEGDDAGAMGVHINKHRGLQGGFVVRNNHIHNNTTYSSVFGRDGAAFEPFRSALWQCYGNTIHDNEIVIETGTLNSQQIYVNLPGGWFHHNYCYGFLCTDSAGPGLLFRTGNGHKIFNNTIVMDGGNSGPTPHWLMRFYSEGGGFGEAVTNTELFNNIIQNGPEVTTPGNILVRIDSAGGVPTPTFTRLDYNMLASPFGSSTTAIYYGGVGVLALSAGGLSTLRSSTVHGDHDIWGTNPLLNADGTPQLGSASINAGLHIPGYTDGYIGAAPDIGAFEYSTAPNTETADATVATGTGAAPGPSITGGQARLRITMG